MNIEHTNDSLKHYLVYQVLKPILEEESGFRCGIDFKNEAAKIIENIQRDLNIALINEVSPIFEKMGLNHD